MRIGVLLLLFCIPTWTDAQPIEPGTIIEGAVRGRPWPIGLGINAKLGYQQPFYSAEHRALERNGYELGASLQASPVSAHPGVYLKLTPLTVLEVEIGGQFLTYFGALNSVLVYPSEAGDWSLRGQERRKAEVGLMANTGWTTYVLTRGKLMVKSVVLVSEFEHRFVNVGINDGETWYDAERHRLMRQSDVYNRSLTILGWLFGTDVSNSDMLAGALWREWNQIQSGDRTLAGAAFVRQRRTESHQTRWLILAAVYTQDKYQLNEPFGAFIWQRTWSL